MTGNFIAILVAASLGQFPGAGAPYGNQIPAPPPGSYQGPGGGGGPGASQYGPGAVLAAPNSTQAFNTGDPFYPYDHEPNWTHGYFQEIPAYGGFHHFRPYNYKNVMPQSQVSAAWGNAANMPYSHQYFDRVTGHQTVGSFIPQSSVAQTSQDLNQQLSRIDGKPRLSTQRRSRDQQFVQGRSNPGVTPAGHRGN